MRTRCLPVDVDAQVWVLPDLEANILLGVEEVVHHLVVDLEVAHGYQALCAVRRQPLQRTNVPTRRDQILHGRRPRRGRGEKRIPTVSEVRARARTPRSGDMLSASTPY